MKKYLGVTIIFLLVIFSIFLWYLRMPLVERFYDFNTTTTSLGEISGLVGMNLLLVTIILSGRFKFLEKYFGGLNKIYFWHHFLGGLALLFLLVHPIVLVLKYIKLSLYSAAMFLLPMTSGGAVAFGTIALLFLILLLIFTFFIKFPYKTWKITHKFLGIVLFFGILHTFLIPSDVSLYLPLKIYMAFLVFVTILAFSYRTLFGNIFIYKFNYIVSVVHRLNEEVVEIVMSAKNEKLKFSAGQFIFISFRRGGVGREIHPFSISSAERDTKLAIIVKSLGTYTKKLQNLKVGAKVKIEGPFGIFSYLNSSNKNQVWIAGGIGITPFLSMAKSLREKNYKIDLYYCVNNKNEVIYYDEFKKISFENNNFKLIPVYSDVNGRLNINTIEHWSGDILKKDFFICGPSGMMKSVRSLLLARGIPDKSIHSEEFTY